MVKLPLISAAERDGRTVVNVFESASDTGRNLIVAAVLEVEEELRVILFVRPSAL